MSKKCCAKQNIISYPDGTSYCQSCQTQFNGDEAVPVGGASAEDLAALTAEVRSQRDDVVELKRQLGEAKDQVASLSQRVLTLEGNVVTPS